MNAFTPLVVAFDGVSGSGKSSTAKAVAERVRFLYLDTGAMYRAVTHACLSANIPVEDDKAAAALGHKLSFTVEENTLCLDGRPVGPEIRTPEVSRWVSDYCKIPEVRRQLVASQRKLGLSTPSVVDGRDIGTVVFPDSPLKFFFWADPEVRAQRRFEELKRAGLDASYEEVLNNLLERDEKDQNRSLSPLVQAEDALKIDTSHLSFREQVESIVVKIKDSPAFKTLFN